MIVEIYDMKSGNNKVKFKYIYKKKQNGFVDDDKSIKKIKV